MTPAARKLLLVCFILLSFALADFLPAGVPSINVNQAVVTARHRRRHHHRRKHRHRHHRRVRVRRAPVQTIRGQRVPDLYETLRQLRRLNPTPRHFRPGR